MIPNSLLPRKGENEKIFTRMGEVFLGVEFLGTDPTIANKIKDFTGSVPGFRV